MKSFQLIQKLSFEEIKKYNGKSVKIEKFIDFFFNSDLCSVCVYFPSLRASDLFKIRFLLKSRKILLIKFKKKNSFVSLKLINSLSSFSCMRELLQLLNVSGFFLVCENFEHFIYFNSLLSSKLFFDKMVILFLKLNTQCFLLDSEKSKEIFKVLKPVSFNLVSVRSFFSFSFIFILSFLFFLLSLRVQFYLFGIIFKVL